MTDGEKLSLAINALRKIAGDPETDEPGEQVLPSARIARETLSKLSVSMMAPARMRTQ